MATTIRSGISDVVNVLNKVRNNTTVAQEQIDLQKLINVLFILWQQVIFDQLDRTDADYKAAIKSLNDAEKSAKAALKDLKQVAEAIKAATAAVKAVDKVVNFAIKLLV
jgi:septal ring factor EnvC (AmiA/AmiB activator)